MRAWLNKNLLGFSIASMLQDFSEELLAVVLPLFIVSLVGAQRAPLVTGLISGMAQLAASLTRLLSGAISDCATRKKPFIILGYALSSLCLGFIGLVHSVKAIAVFMISALVGKGLREAPRDALISFSVPTKAYGRAFGFHRAMDTIGAILGPLLAMFLVYYEVPIRNFFFVAWVAGAFCVLALFILVKEQTLRMNSKLLEACEFKFRLKSIFKHYRSLPVSFLVFVGVVAIFASAAFSRTLLVLRAQELIGLTSDSTKLNLLSSAFLYIIFNIVRALSEYSTGYLSDTLSSEKVLAYGGYMLFTLGALLLSLGVNSASVLVFAFILFGISAATVKVVTRVYAALLLPIDMRSTGFALVQTVEGVGDLIASAVVGFLWSHISPFYAFCYSALLALCAAFLILNLKRIQALFS